jgi:hypothetical protein
VPAGDLDAAAGAGERLSARARAARSDRGAQSVHRNRGRAREALRALSTMTAAAKSPSPMTTARAARAFDAIAEQSAICAAAPGDYVDLFETAISDRRLPPRRETGAGA